VRPFLVHHAFGLRLAALVVVGGIVKPAVTAHVQRPVASRTRLAKPDPLPCLYLPPAEMTVHRNRPRPPVLPDPGIPSFFAGDTLGSIARGGGAGEADDRGDRSIRGGAGKGFPRVAPYRGQLPARPRDVPLLSDRPGRRRRKPGRRGRYGRYRCRRYPGMDGQDDEGWRAALLRPKAPRRRQGLLPPPRGLLGSSQSRPHAEVAQARAQAAFGDAGRRRPPAARVRFGRY